MIAGQNNLMMRTCSLSRKWVKTQAKCFRVGLVLPGDSQHRAWRLCTQVQMQVGGQLGYELTVD